MDSPTPTRFAPITVSNAGVAAQLGVSLKAVKNLIDRGQLKTVVLPLKKRPRVLQSSVDAAFKQIYEAEPQAV
jgi:hypothetical protein